MTASLSTTRSAVRTGFLLVSPSGKQKTHLSLQHMYSACSDLIQVELETLKIMVYNGHSDRPSSSMLFLSIPIIKLSTKPYNMVLQPSLHFPTNV